MKQITTLVIIEKNDQVLLAMKKRGFGEGRWNGYGGKVKEDETVEKAMTRELEEESSIVAKDFKKRGIINFFFQGTDKKNEMHIFEVTDYEGEPKETEEMAPKWFDKKDIPYDKMWPADKEWMPLFFEGKDIEGTVTFDRVTKKIVKANIYPKQEYRENDLREVGRQQSKYKKVDNR